MNNFERIFKKITPKENLKIKNIKFKLKVENDNQEYHFTDLMFQEGANLAPWIEHTSEMYRTKAPRVVIRYRDITRYQDISDLLVLQGANGGEDLNSILSSIKDVFVQIYNTIKNKGITIKDDKLSSIIEAINNIQISTSSLDAIAAALVSNEAFGITSCQSTESAIIDVISSHTCKGSDTEQQTLEEIQQALIERGVEVNDAKKIIILSSISTMLDGICDAFELKGFGRPNNDIPSIIDFINSISTENLDLVPIQEKLNEMGWITSEATVNSILNTLNKTILCTECSHNNCYYIQEEQYPAVEKYPDPTDPTKLVDPTIPGRGCKEYANCLFLDSSVTFWVEYGEGAKFDIQIVYAKQGPFSTNGNSKFDLEFNTGIYTENIGDFLGYCNNTGFIINLLEGNDNEILTKNFTYTTTGYQEDLAEALMQFPDAVPAAIFTVNTENINSTTYKFWIYKLIITSYGVDGETTEVLYNDYPQVDIGEKVTFTDTEVGTVDIGPDYAIAPWKRYE